MASKRGKWQFRWTRALALAFLLALPSGNSTSGEGEEWPGVAIQTVRAYAWPATQDTETLVQSDLTPAPGAIDPNGKPLSAEQIKRLMIAAARKMPAGRRSMVGCFQPHHAFICYDATGRPVAFLEFSLRYHGYRVSPEAPEREPHYGDLASLCVELGLPFHKEFDLDDYRREFEDTYINGAGFEGAD